MERFVRGKEDNLPGNSAVKSKSSLKLSTIIIVSDIKLKSSLTFSWLWHGTHNNFCFNLKVLSNDEYAHLIFLIFLSFCRMGLAKQLLLNVFHFMFFGHYYTFCVETKKFMWKRVSCDCCRSIAIPKQKVIEFSKIRYAHIPEKFNDTSNGEN